MNNDIAKVASGPIGYLAVFGVGGYIVYRVIKALWNKGKDMTAPIANVLSDAYIAISQSSPVKVLGGVKLPTGANVPLSQLYIASDFTFTYSGVKYRLTGRDPNDSDNYLAVFA